MNSSLNSSSKKKLMLLLPSMLSTGNNSDKFFLLPRTIIRKFPSNKLTSSAAALRTREESLKKMDIDQLSSLFKLIGLSEEKAKETAGNKKVAPVLQQAIVYVSP